MNCAALTRQANRQALPLPFLAPKYLTCHDRRTRIPLSVPRTFPQLLVSLRTDASHRQTICLTTIPRVYCCGQSIAFWFEGQLMPTITPRTETNPARRAPQAASPAGFISTPISPAIAMPATKVRHPAPHGQTSPVKTARRTAMSHRSANEPRQTIEHSCKRAPRLSHRQKPSPPRWFRSSTRLRYTH